VVAELGFHNVTHGSRLQTEGRLLEGTDHLSPLEILQISPVGTTGAFGRLFGQCRKILTFLGPLLNGLDALAGLGLLVGTRLRINLDQNMTGTDAFRCLEELGMTAVKRFGFLRRDGYFGRHLLVDQFSNN